MTITEIHQKLKNREVSVPELTGHYLSRIKNKDGDFNSYLYVNEQGAKAFAKKAGEAYTEDAADIFGVPYALKDNILAKGTQATAASKILHNYTAPYSAFVVKQLEAGGAIILGKTNMDEFAMGSSTETSAYGVTKNPVDTSRVPGGSSGGSAAAVAADLAPFALGSDTGGSIRQPAAFCGVVGFKPTYGAVSRHGLIAMASSLDQIGPITKTVEDAKIVFKYLRGKDKADATSFNLKEVKAPDIKKLKIGVPKEYFSEGLDERIKQKVREALKVYESAGAKIEQISLPHAKYSLACYYIIMPAEASSNLARYDGVKYGMHEDIEAAGDLLDDYLNTRSKGFGSEVKRRIMLGTHTLSSGYYDAYYLKAQKVRKLIEQDFENAFNKVDIIVGPTTPQLPFKLGEKTDDPVSMYLSDIYTVSANLAGLPSLSMPAGTAKEAGSNLPVGLQLTAPFGRDLALLGIAELYEKAVK